MAYSWKNGILIAPDPAADAAIAAKLDAQVRALLEASNATAVEELLLNRIEQDPFDLLFFVPLLRHFVRNKKEAEAGTFLELLLDNLRGREALAGEISLLRALLSAWPESAAVRASVLGHLSALYAGTSNFKRLQEHCKVLESPAPLQALRQLEIWLRYDEGRGVYLATKGVGRVREVNLTRNVLRVVFALDDSMLSFKPDEAERMLEPLPAGHLLLDMLDNPAGVRELAGADAPELLRRLFASINRPIPLNELRDMLSGIVPAAGWNAWWTGARKERRLTVSTANICSWNDSGDDADSSILREFAEAPVRDKLEMARKYAKRSDALAAAMTGELARCAEEESGRNPALALELFLSLEKISASGAAAYKNRIAEFIAHSEAATFIQTIGDRILRKKAIVLVRENRSDWAVLFAALIKTENDSQSIAILYESLREKEPAIAETLVQETLSSPAGAPGFFLWLCREMLQRPELQPLANWKFLVLIMQILSSSTLKEHNASLRKLFDDDGAFHQAARRIEPDQAKQLIALLDRDSSLEDYRREKMLKDLRAWYPQTQEVKEDVFYVSAESIKQRQFEFHRLTTVDIPRNTEEIIKARAHGDLRENFEYHAARTRQEMLSSRAKTLHDELQFARPIDPARIDPSCVCIGTCVRLRPLNGGEEQSVTILGPWDSDPAQNILSYLAPVAAALLGKKVGDNVIFNENPFIIAEIRTAIT